MIGKIPFILLHCLRLVAENPYHSYQVLKMNLFVGLDIHSLHSLAWCLDLVWTCVEDECEVLSGLKQRKYMWLVLSSDQDTSDHLTRLREQTHVKGFNWSKKTFINLINQGKNSIVSQAYEFQNLNLKKIKVSTSFNF